MLFLLQNSNHNFILTSAWLLIIGIWIIFQLIIIAYVYTMHYIITVYIAMLSIGIYILPETINFVLELPAVQHPHTSITDTYIHTHTYIYMHMHYAWSSHLSMPVDWPNGKPPASYILVQGWKWVGWPGLSGSLGSLFWCVKWVSSVN